jgi:hypothetical protein
VHKQTDRRTDTRAHARTLSQRHKQTTRSPRPRLPPPGAQSGTDTQTQTQTDRHTHTRAPQRHWQQQGLRPGLCLNSRSAGGVVSPPVVSRERERRGAPLWGSYVDRSLLLSLAQAGLLAASSVDSLVCPGLKGCRRLYRSRVSPVRPLARSPARRLACGAHQLEPRRRLCPISGWGIIIIQVQPHSFDMRAALLNCYLASRARTQFAT